jgi:hypothetical protein
MATAKMERGKRGPVRQNRRIPTSNGIAPKGNGGSQCRAANFDIALTRPHPPTPRRASSSQLKAEPPSVPNRLGVFLWREQAGTVRQSHYLLKVSPGAVR